MPGVFAMEAFPRTSILLATALAFGGAFGVATQWPRLSQRDQELKKLNGDLRFYKSYSDIDIGMLDRDVERLFGTAPQLVQGPEWPATLGAIPGYQYGCPASLLLRANSELEKLTYNPNNPVHWLRWELGDGRWIAIACLGEAALRNTSAVLVVAKRRSPD